MTAIEKVIKRIEESPNSNPGSHLRPGLVYALKVLNQEADNEKKKKDSGYWEEVRRDNPIEYLP